MKTASAFSPVVTADSSCRTGRDWFLMGTSWDDAIWSFAPTNLLEEREAQRVRWDFTLPRGGRFTDPDHASLLQTSKQLIALIRKGSMFTGRSQRSRTAVKYFSHLRLLLRWMDQEEILRFADLDAAALLRFQQTIMQRKGRIGSAITRGVARGHFMVLVCLYHFRDELGDGLRSDPFAGQRPGVPGNTRYGRYTPDVVAVPLIQRSIEFLENATIDTLRAREIYAESMAEALKRRRKNGNCNVIARLALRSIRINTPHGTQQILTIPNLSNLLDMLYAACFVVISYLVGARVSEILQLRAGCVQPRPTHTANGETEIVVMVGALFKKEPGYHGRPHEWVVPQAAIHAIAVLEALSAPHRSYTGRSELWLRARCRARSHGATEWQRKPTGSWPIQIATAENIGNLMERYARWLDLPFIEGRQWHPTTYQGRKTFARFAALRDRTSLYALAQQLGHRDRSMTDSGYAGTDYVLEREIRSEVLEQSFGAWEHMLSTPRLGGRAGSVIMAKRPQFRGARTKNDIKTYARMLVEAGLVLGVCDYGYCVYRQEYSACRGNAAGPNPVYREPSTCVRCLNFAVSTEHRPYWLEQMRRCEALRNEPALPTQTLKIARERFEEARDMLRSIDASAKEEAHARKAPASEDPA
jgi:integrase